MSTPGRSYPKRSRQSTGGISTYSTSRRPRRSAGTARTSTGGVIGATIGITTENLGVAAQKWYKVYRAPMAPTDEPYFGSSATASFVVPTWVRIDELTPDEKRKYEEEEKKRGEQRAIWRKELAARTAKEEAEKKKKEEEERQRRESEMAEDSGSDGDGNDEEMGGEQEPSEKNDKATTDESTAAAGDTATAVAVGQTSLTETADALSEQNNDLAAIDAANQPKEDQEEGATNNGTCDAPSTNEAAGETAESTTLTSQNGDEPKAEDDEGGIQKDGVGGEEDMNVDTNMNGGEDVNIVAVMEDSTTEVASANETKQAQTSGNDDQGVPVSEPPDVAPTENSVEDVNAGESTSPQDDGQRDEAGNSNEEEEAATAIDAEGEKNTHTLSNPEDVAAAASVAEDDLAPAAQSQPDKEGETKEGSVEESVPVDVENDTSQNEMTEGQTDATTAELTVATEGVTASQAAAEPTSTMTSEQDGSNEE